MSDNLSKEQRHKNMQHIRSTGTKPEEIVRKYLFSQGFRYRKNVAKLPGKPDIVLPKFKTVIFVNGCFWHMHEGCRYFVWPKNNSEYWEKKIKGNVERDNRNHTALERAGWRVLIVWECKLKKDLENTLEQLSSVLRYDKEPSNRNSD